MKLRSWWRSVRGRERLNADIDAELSFHIEMEVERLVREGVAADVARRQALLSFGGVEQYRQAGREARFGIASSTPLDMRLGFRMLRKYPGITIVGGLAFAFAIAVGTGAFEFLDQLVSPRLPLPDGNRVVGVQVWEGAAGAAEYEHWQQSVRTIESLSAFRTQDRNFAVAGRDRELVQLAEITPAGLRLARVPALHGRLFDEADAQPGAPEVVILGYELWQRALAGDASAIGRTVRVGGALRTVVGVMPEGFLFPVHHDLWLPLHAASASGPLTVFGRLAPGASIDRARTELRSVSARLLEPGSRQQVTVLPYTQAITGITGYSSLALRSANLFLVMLLALVCANVALLMYARAATRENEIVVRGALGATPGRIVLLFFTEALALGAVALVLGLAASRFALRAWMHVSTLEAGSRLPFWFNATLAPTTILYALGLTVLGAAIAGAVPGIKVVRGIGDQLRRTSAGGGGLQFGGIWTAVIVAQVAMTVAFPATTYFVRREIVRNQARDLALPAEQYLSARLEYDGADRVEYAALLADLERRLEAQASVTAVTFGTALPRMLHRERSVEIEGMTERADGEAPPRSGVNAVSTDYFTAFNTAPSAGRAFTGADVTADARVVIVNESFVREQLAGGNAVGRRVRYAATRAQAQSDWYEIVGVVPDLGSLTGGYGDDALYHPVRPGTMLPMSIAVHVRGDAAAFARRLDDMAAAVDPALRLHDVMTLDRAGASLWLEFNFLFKLLIGTSGLALLLSLGGIYAVMAFTVARRTREIGVRLALGAQPGRIVLATLRQPLRQVGSGIVAGGALVGMLTVAVFGGTITAPQVALVSLYALLMMGVCLLACVVPTRRVLRVQPTRALAGE